ncbi:MAG: hypothetical protein M3R25_01665, partial [Bacteroidota bacterium]|nr:hypothetical protein [Bacteroidota bacterium]
MAMKLVTLLVTSFLASNIASLYAQTGIRVRANDTTSMNTMVEALNTNSGAFFGENAGMKNVGFANAFFGSLTGENNTSGIENTFIGNGAGQNNKTGHFNTYLGREAGRYSGGNRNVLLGYNAGTFAAGSDNVIIGCQAGKFANGIKNVLIGNEAGMNEAGSNKFYLENSSADSSNALLYGNFSTDYLRTKSRMEVFSAGTTTPAFKAIKSYATGTFTDMPGVLGENNADDNWGIGVKGVGGYIGSIGTVLGTGSGSYFGVMAECQGINAGTNYGFFSSTSGATSNVALYASTPIALNNHAGFFDGRVYVGNILGVGKIATSYPIEVKGNGTNGLMQFYNNTNTAKWILRLEPNGGLGFIEPSATEAKLVIASGGNIGVGIANPGANVHVFSANEPTLKLQSDGIAENSGRLSMRQSDNTGTDIYFDGVSDQLVIESFTGNTSMGKQFIINQSTGDIGIGTTDLAAGHMLSVNGKIACTEILILPQSQWPDYVFQEEYALRSIEAIKDHIDEFGHLPGIPSATEIA